MRKVTFALGVLSERKEVICTLFKLGIMRGRFFFFLSHGGCYISQSDSLLLVTFMLWFCFVLVLIGGVVWVICISSCDHCGARNYDAGPFLYQ